VRAIPVLIGAVVILAVASNLNCSKKSPTTPTPPPPVCQVVPPSLNFGVVAVGQGRDMTFTIQNVGGGTLSGTISDTCSTFSILSDPSFVLGAGQSKVFTARFAPVREGAQSCSILTGSSGCAVVTCSGSTPTAPACQVSPSPLDFGTVPVNGTKDLQLRLTNVGGGTLAGILSESCPNFGIVGSASFSLTAGQSATFTVRFAPTAGGQQNCSLATGNALCGSVTLSGTGQLPSPIEIARLDFGNVAVGQTVSRQFTIFGSSCGSRPYGVCTYENSEAYLVAGADPGAPSLFCVTRYQINFPWTYTVDFTPTVADTQGAIIELTCETDQIDQHYTSFGYVSCTGVGYVAPGSPACQLSAISLNFGTVAVGSSADRQVTVTNTGGGILNGSITPCDPFFIVGDPSFSLTAGQSKLLTVRFAPSVAGLSYGCYLHLADPVCPWVQAEGMSR
jgi:hypothetical protein